MMDSFKLRDYQEFIFREAINRNLIVSLPTGTGKTLIAVHLLQEFLRDTIGEYPTVSKRSIFLAPTKILVEQQCSVMKKYLPAQIVFFTGDQNVDDFDVETWNKHLKENQILVMTPAILENILIKGYIKFENINVIVFDEAHWLTKKKQKQSGHPYRSIMDIYFLQNSFSKPRILAMTASLFNSYVEDCNFEKYIYEIENLYDGKICIHDTEHFFKSAKVYIISYDNTSPQLKKYFPLDIERFKSKFDKIESDSSFVKDIKYHLDKIKSTLTETMGPWFSLELCQMLLENTKVAAQLRTSFQKFIRMFIKNINCMYFNTNVLEQNQLMQLSLICSERIQNLLKTISIIYSNVDELNMIIFVNERIDGNLIFRWLKFISENFSQYDWIKPGFICGTFSKGFLNLDNATKNLHEKFANKQLNILIATSVLEEGIDVPICNVVIRYDFPMTFRAYCQSKGRARDKSSLYFLMVDISDEKTKANCIKKLRSYYKVENYLKNTLKSTLMSDVECYEDNSELNAVFYTKSGAMLKERYSLQLINIYLSKLSCDFFTDSRPIFFYFQKCKVTKKFSLFKINKHLKQDYNSSQTLSDCIYCCIFMFPVNSLFSGRLVKGKFRSSLHAAKHNCALNVCRFLYENGELDEHLNVARKIFFIQKHVDELNLTAHNSATNVETRPYSFQYSKYFNLKPNIDTKMYYLYKLSFTVDSNKNFLEENRFLFANEQQLNKPIIGLLLKKIFPLETVESYFYFKKILVKFSLQLINKMRFDQSESNGKFRLIQFFHSHVLDNLIEDHLNKTEDNIDDNLFYIVPILQRKQNSSINFELIQKLQQFCTIRSDIIKDQHVDNDNPFTTNEKQFDCNKTIDCDQVLVPCHHDRIQLVYKKNISQLTIDDQLPSEELKFKEFYKQRYDLNLRDTDNPLIHVGFFKKISKCFNINSFVGKKPKESIQHRFFPIELLMNYPLSGCLTQWLMSIPYVLFRLEQICVSHEFIEQISIDFNWNNVNYDSKFDVDTVLKGSLKKRSSDDDVDEIVDEKNIELIDVDNFSLNTKMNTTESQFTKVFDSIEREESLENNVPIEDDLSNVDGVFENFYLILKSFLPKIQMDKKKYFSIERTKIGFGETSGFRHTGDIERYIEGHFDTFWMEDCPQPAQILQCLTLKKINDMWNLEHLETVGDAFIKMTSALYLYFNYERYEEGKLVELKSQMISNMNLYNLALRKDLHKIIFGKTFEYKKSWMPPFPQYQTNRYEADNKQILKFKDIADCVESLIGAFLVYGNGGSAIKFLNWIGLKTFDPVSQAPIDLNSFQTNMNGDIIFYDDFEDDVDIVEDYNANQEAWNFLIQFKAKDFNTIVLEEYDLFKMENVEKTINYTFKNKFFLVNAFTHSSYQSDADKLRVNCISSYQRLEFIGDAILDYLTTHFIHMKDNTLSPEEITNLRVALVNNVFYANVSVKLGLHKHLRYNNHSLLMAINNFLMKKSENFFMKFDSSIIYQIEETEALTIDEVDVPKVLADLFESLVGAIFLDCGYSFDQVWRVVFPLIKVEFDHFFASTPLMPLSILEKNYKNNYEFGKLEDYSSEQGSRRKIILTINEKQFIGYGTNKRECKMSAAKRALAYLENISNSDDDINDDSVASDDVST